MAERMNSVAGTATTGMVVSLLEARVEGKLEGTLQFGSRDASGS